MIARPSAPVTRARFWLFGLSLWTSGLIAVEAAQRLLGTWPASVAALVLVVLSLYLCVQRLRDRGRSPVWLLMLLVPLLGPLVLFIELGLRGSAANQTSY